MHRRASADLRRASSGGWGGGMSGVGAVRRGRAARVRQGPPHLALQPVLDHERLRRNDGRRGTVRRGAALRAPHNTHTQSVYHAKRTKWAHRGEHAQ
jgi:hypothetical protein